MGDRNVADPRLDDTMTTTVTAATAEAAAQNHQRLRSGGASASAAGSLKSRPGGAATGPAGSRATTIGEVGWALASGKYVAEKQIAASAAAMVRPAFCRPDSGQCGANTMGVTDG